MKQILTDNDMRMLFGENHKGLLYYNMESQKWNTDTYLGKKIHDQHVDTKLIQYAFGGNIPDTITPIAVAVMTINDKTYRGPGVNITDPKFDPRGTAVAGTVVFRNNQTGKLMTQPKNWTGTFQHDNQSCILAFGMRSFLIYCIRTRYQKEKAKLPQKQKQISR